MRRSFNKVAVSTKMIGALAAATATAAISALWVEHRARKAERDNPPDGLFVEVDGVPLHYVDKGEGPPVVLLHGNAVLLQDFIASGLIDRLAERHRVIAFDRPGFGYSGRPRDRLWTAQAQAALIQRALVQIGVEQPVVLGHSWGALVALGMADRAATDVRGLVLISGYYYPTARADVALAAPAALPIVGDVLRYTVSPLTGRLLLKRTVQAMFAPAPVPGNFFESVKRELVLRPVQIRAQAEDAAFMIPAAAHFKSRYWNLQMRVSIFAGADDKVIDPDSNSVRLHRAIPHSTLVVAPGAGHMVHYAIPAEIVEAIDVMSAQLLRGPGDSDAAICETSATVEKLPVPAEAKLAAALARSSSGSNSKGDSATAGKRLA
ncbi:alpha/beta fold hydrolase [Pararobbsia alpina]|uniref:Haloalkane dehalogenase n=1 Tax=Pararobbsia alpina TaxID=621374 RepID=A0A6S7BS80_9BURK|nr:alpha/beta hydrolase [Pararobbsia alpina]CAB3800676.1 Haloalkane dehalogenase [Pararobbsia alpina]